MYLYHILFPTIIYHGIVYKKRYLLYYVETTLKGNDGNKMYFLERQRLDGDDMLNSLR